MTVTKLSEAVGKSYSLDKILLEEDPKLTSPSASSVVTPEKQRSNQYLALDCEFLGAGTNGSTSVLARVAVVNYYGLVLVNEFVKPTEPVTDWRTAVTGVTASDLQNARSFAAVKQDVLRLVKQSIIVGHDLGSDLQCFGLVNNIPESRLRDTAQYQPFCELNHGKKASLKDLAKVVLHKDIQTSAHLPIEDAQTAMLLFRLNKKGFQFEK